jgi:hypothetical protein
VNRTSARQAIAIALLAGSGLLASAIPAAAATAQAARPSRTGTVATLGAASGGCYTGNRLHYVHVTFQTINGRETECFGGKGEWIFSANDLVRVCAGNNYGAIHYNPAGQGERRWYFTPGESKKFGADTSLIDLRIYRWKGSETC